MMLAEVVNFLLMVVMVLLLISFASSSLGSTSGFPPAKCFVKGDIHLYGLCWALIQICAAGEVTVVATVVH